MYGAYSNKNYLLVVSGKFVSLLGSSIYYIGLIWYVLSSYGETSGRMVSWIFILGILPTVFLGGVLGAAADRYNKKRIIVISDMISGVVMLGLTGLMGKDTLYAWYLLTATVILSITTTLVAVSVNSIIPEILKREHLQSASAGTLLIDRATGLLGFAFGGIFIAAFGVRMVFLFNGVSFIVSALLEMLIRYSPPEGVQRSSVSAGELVGDIKEVLGFLASNRNFAGFVFVFTFVNFLWDPVLNITVPYVMKTELNITSGQFGFLEAALPLGFCAGALVFSRYEKIIRRKDTFYYSIMGINVCLTLFAAPLIFTAVYAGRPGCLVYYLDAMLIISGVFSAALNIKSSVTIQELIPDSVRGKVWGLTISLSRGLIPLGGGIVGYFIGRIPSYVFLLVSVAGVYALLLVWPRAYFAPGESMVFAAQDNKDGYVPEKFSAGTGHEGKPML